MIDHFISLRPRKRGYFNLYKKRSLGRISSLAFSGLRIRAPCRLLRRLGFGSSVGLCLARALRVLGTCLRGSSVRSGRFQGPVLAAMDNDQTSVIYIFPNDDLIIVYKRINHPKKEGPGGVVSCGSITITIGNLTNIICVK